MKRKNSFHLRKGFLFACLWTISLGLFSQNITVTGKVTEMDNEPAIGVTIIVQGNASIGSITDIDGNYTLSGVPDNGSLIFSYVGMKSQVVPVNGRSTIDVVLQPDNELLDEVVVVGYGTTSTRMAVGAVSSLKTDKIQDLPFSNTSLALQGRTPGVVIEAAGGEPGSKPRISIRGGGTPLYVIDGVVRSEYDFNSLNASDIEKMSILKDASATAVYGSRAGDGIVLVQTKRGRQGKMSIQYTGGLDFSRPTVMPEKVGALDYVLAVNQASEYDGRTTLPYSSEDIEKIRNSSDPYGQITSNTDWMKLALKDYAMGTRHNLSLSGVSENGINIYTAVGYLKQNSLFKEEHNNPFERFNLRSNVSTTFKEIGLEVGVNIDAALEKRNPTVWGNYSVWSQLQGVKPNYAPFNPDGTYTSISVHPLVILDKRAGYNRENDKYINTQIYANWNVPTLEGLSMGVLGNVRYGDWNQKIFQSKAPQYQPDGQAVPYTSNYLRMGNSRSSETSLDLNAMYKKSIDLHNFELQAVYSFYQTYGENFWAQREKYLSSQFDQLFAGDASTQKNEGSASERARLGYVGRVKYDWNRRYLFEGNFRIDQSDNFPAGSRTGFFPSGAAAWVVSEEPFMEKLKEDNIINFFKIRSSYGIVGLEDGVRFGYLPVYDIISQSTIIDGKFTTGFREGPLVSNDLSWYTRQVFDIGFDMSFLDDRLFAAFDYYYYRTKGYLIAPQNRYTTPLGKSLPYVKSESAHRRAGYEANIRWKDQVDGFGYDLGVNFTSYNELWEKKEDEQLSTLKNPNSRVTHVKNYYGSAYKTNGLYQSIEEIINNPRRESANQLKPGDLQFADLNGDGKVDGEDFQRIGKPTFPSFSYGFDFNLDYKNFFLNGLLQGTGTRYKDLEGFMRASNTEYLTYDFQLDYWTPENRDAAFPRLSTYQNLNAGQNYTVSADYWYRNAAYLRLKALQFGYDFKDFLKNNKAISSVKLSLAATNPVTFSGVNKYFDPEISANTGYAYPTQKSYSVVLNVTF
jgi:TonB-linked SusC/RagA family outer membrane protein